MTGLRFIFNLKIKGSEVFSFGEKIAIIDGSNLTVLVEPNMTNSKHLVYIALEFDLDIINNFKNQ